MILTLLLVQRRRPRRGRRDGHQRRPRRRLPRLHQRRVLSESGPSAMSHGTPSIVPVQAAMPATPQLGQRPRQRAGARRAPCRAVPRRFEGSRERWVRSGRAADPAPLPPMKPRTSRPRKPLARGHSAWGRPAAGRPLIRSIDAHSLPHRVAKFGPEVPHALRNSVYGVLEPGAAAARSDEFDARGGAGTVAGRPPGQSSSPFSASRNR